MPAVYWPSPRGAAMSVDVVVRLEPDEWSRLVAYWKNRAAWFALTAVSGWLATVALGFWIVLGCGR
jgi:hypothetical protein